MPTINNARRVMRPPPGMDEFPPACKWCGKAVGRGVIFTAGMDLGKVAIVCPECLTPPAFGARHLELSNGKEW